MSDKKNKGGRPRKFEEKLERWSSYCTEPQAKRIVEYSKMFGYKSQAEYFRGLANPEELFGRMKLYFERPDSPTLN